MLIAPQSAGAAGGGSCALTFDAGTSRRRKQRTISLRMATSWRSASRFSSRVVSRVSWHWLSRALCALTQRPDFSSVRPVLSWSRCTDERVRARNQLSVFAILERVERLHADPLGAGQIRRGNYSITLNQ